MGRLWAVGVGALVWVGCGGAGVDPVPVDGRVPVRDSGAPTPVEDGGVTPVAPDAGDTLDAGSVDSGRGGTVTPDGGSGFDAGTDGGSAPDAGPTFGGPGPWPLTNTSYGTANGVLESPVVGTTTDETQNLWVGTHAALYLLQPGQTSFKRFAAADGLHLQGNPVTYCDSNFGGGDKSCPILGAAADPGITEIVGGGPNEVLVGYAGLDEGTGDWSDLNRHSGKVDRVRWNAATGTLQVDRLDLVSNNHGAQYWHNRTVQRMVYDHFTHPHELYVGTNHGVDLLRPDQFRKANPGEWFDTVNMEYMADHLHARVCFHAACDNTESNQRMGDWRGLALSPDGHLWTAGKWTAGKIKWDPLLSSWFSRGGSAFLAAFGDPYPTAPNAGGFVNEPVFPVPQEGDVVNLSAVSVAPDGKVWFASGPVSSSPGDIAYGIASWDGQKFTRYDPVSELGLPGATVRDLIALPSGRVVVASPSGGLVIWNPATGAKQSLQAPLYLLDNQVIRLDLDTMVSPPALHVSTATGTAVLRQLPTP